MLGLGEPPGLLGRRSSPLRVPHHREEHRRHQRDLGELVGTFVAASDRPGERGARDHHHDEQDEHRRAEAPQPDAVDEREADPHEVERDRLPVAELQDDRDVGGREQPPRDLDPASTER
jgi:hypothetical protein